VRAFDSARNDSRSHLFVSFRAPRTARTPQSTARHTPSPRPMTSPTRSPKQAPPPRAPEAGEDEDASLAPHAPPLLRAPSTRPPRLVTSWGEEEEEEDESDDDDDDDDEPPSASSQAPLAAPTPSTPAWPLASPALVAGRSAKPAAAATPPPAHSHLHDDDPEARFALLDELGRGSHGAVFAAADSEDGNEKALVAVKVVAAVGADVGALAREVEALVGCAHPAVVQHIVSLV